MHVSKNLLFAMTAAILLSVDSAAGPTLTHPSMAGYAYLEAPVAPTGYLGLTARFYGTTSLLFSDGRDAIVLDGFISRPGVLQVLLNPIQPVDSLVDLIISDSKPATIRAVLVAHAHYDHSLDAPYLASKSGAMMMGTESTRYAAIGQKFIGDFKVPTPHEPIDLGPYSVTAFRSPHSPGAMATGRMTETLTAPAHASRMSDNENFSYLLTFQKTRSFLLHPSANFAPGLYKDVRAEVVFLGIAGLSKQGEQFTRQYWKETVEAVGARLVIPVHWDALYIPLAEPMQPLPVAYGDFDETMGLLVKLAGESRQTTLRLMPVRHPVVIDRLQ